MTEFFRTLLIAAVKLLIGARSDWRGTAPSFRQRIYFANHSSHFDTLAVTAALPAMLRAKTCPVAARDYWGKSALRRTIAVTLLRSVLIDRTHSEEGDPLAPVFECLEDGKSVLIFPEGTRGSGETIAPFRNGLFRLAEAFPDIELVPAYLDNLSRIMPKGSFLIVPITSTVHFGAPIALRPGEDKTMFLDRARQAVQALERPLA